MVYFIRASERQLVFSDKLELAWEFQVNSNCHDSQLQHIFSNSYRTMQGRKRNNHCCQDEIALMSTPIQPGLWEKSFITNSNVFRSLLGSSVTSRNKISSRLEAYWSTRTGHETGRTTLETHCKWLTVKTNPHCLRWADSLKFRTTCEFCRVCYFFCCPTIKNHCKPPRKIHQKATYDLVLYQPILPQF